MEHYLPHPLSGAFACGADAVGRRNTRTQTNPYNTTCARCQETDVWFDAVDVVEA